MQEATSTNYTLMRHQRYSHQQAAQVGFGVLVMAGLCVPLSSMSLQSLWTTQPQLGHGLLILMACAFAFSTLKAFLFNRARKQLSDFQLLQRQLNRLSENTSIDSLQAIQTCAERMAGSNYLAVDLWQRHRPLLEQRLEAMHKLKLLEELEAACKKQEEESATQLIRQKQNLPLYQAKQKLAHTLTALRRRRHEMEQEWRVAYEGFSWWNKLKYGEQLDFKEMDEVIHHLTILQARLEQDHAEDFEKIEQHYQALQSQAVSRLVAVRQTLNDAIRIGTYEAEITDSTFNKAFWLSAMSVPVSVWADVDRAGDIYDSLRGVHSGFSGMSDTEIWWQTLFMPAESLAGLAALAKGAYFEQLVASDTGGQLHEYFITPDTDIVIDGVAFQLKATDSEAYIASVDDDIPVIATSEVTATTDAIDSGISNADITQSVDAALGGMVVDAGDTAADAILTGIGGLGLFATMDGINHAAAKYKNGGDGVEAMLEGAGVALEGTARGLVGAAEMGYKVVASRPARFVGRVLLRSVKKLDQKLMEGSERK